MYYKKILVDMVYMHLFLNKFCLIALQIVDTSDMYIPATKFCVRLSKNQVVLNQYMRMYHGIVHLWSLEFLSRFQITMIVRVWLILLCVLSTEGIRKDDAYENTTRDANCFRMNIVLMCLIIIGFQENLERDAFLWSKKQLRVKRFMSLHVPNVPWYMVYILLLTCL